MSDTNTRCSDSSPEVNVKRSAVSSVIANVNNYVVPVVKGFPALVCSTFCVYTFYNECYEQDPQKPFSMSFLAFVITFANAFAGMPMFKDESFLEFRILLDYAQEILPLPCICTELWIKYDMANFWINCLHIALGLFTFLFYVIYEIKRVDLTDLTILVNAMSMVAVGTMNENVYAVLAAIVFFGYYYFKRRKEECCLKHTDIFNSVMMVFNVIALLAFEPKNLVPEFFGGSLDSQISPSQSLLSLMGGAEEGGKKKKGKKAKNGVGEPVLPQTLISLLTLAFSIINI